MLETVLLEEEYSLIPEGIRSKIDKILSETSERYLNVTALHETFKRDQDEAVGDLQTKLKQEIERRESIQLEFEKTSQKLNEFDAKVDSLQKQSAQLKNDLIYHENEARTYRIQRDDIADEKSSLQAILNRRSNELENLKSDYDSINEKYKLAVQEKIEALTQLDEIQAKKIELDFKEKRLEQEKNLINEQINLLSSDVTKHHAEMSNVKREHSTQLISLQAEVQQKNEEIRVLLENEQNYKRTIETLNDKIEELNNRLTGQSEVENELRNKYVAEIESRTKLAEVYKEMSEESGKKCEELASTAKDLQKLLSEAAVQYEDLEKRYTINETTYKEHLQKKNDTIAALKKELADANNLIDTLKQGHLNDTLENLSPHAAAAYNIMRKGLTLTQIYSEYASVSEQLLIKTHDNEQLQNTFKAFIEELEGKAHIIRKRNEDYAEAMATIEKISQSYGQLELDYDVMKEKLSDSERNTARLTRENERLHKTISDLSRQVCFLLKEVEESRGGEILIRQVGDSSDYLNSSDIISKKLVTFHDIQELQQNNQKLLATIRDLSEEFENAEIKLKAYNKEELETTVSSLQNSISEKNEAFERQEKIIQMLKNQLKMYKLLGADKAAGDRSFNENAIMDVPMIESDTRKVASIQTSGSEIESAHCAELQKELAAKKREIANLKAKLDTCTREHSINEKMMMENLEKAEKSFQKLSHDYKALISRAENNEEKCKCFKLTIGSLKAEITALENKCKTYSQTIGKHEQTITVLRDEAMNAMSELSRSQVLLENSKRECAMLRESEARLIAERDVLRQDKQNHAYLLSNIESIKTSIERSESEWKMKIEQKWNAAEQECSALRRRLQDEQDRYNEKIAFLEQIVESSKSRLDEEKKSSTDLSNMIDSLKADLEEKTKTIDELKSKLRTSSSENFAEKELRMKNLQNKYEMALKDIEHYKGLLEAAKKDSQEISKLSGDFESMLVSEREVYLQSKKDMEAKICELAGEVAGLQKQNAVLQKRVSELSNLNQTSMINLNDELMEEKRKYLSMSENVNALKQQLAHAQTEMKAALDAKLTAEKKYTDEMLQHTEDIKELKKQIEVVVSLQNRIDQLTIERDAAILRAESNMSNWHEQENRIRDEMHSQNQRLKDLVSQNELLLNQIQELSLKLSIRQSQDPAKDDKNASTSSEGGDRNADNLLQVISYLRREKNLATSQLETLLSENRRLKSETDLIKRQLDETRALLESEQQKSDISSTTAAKHAELINKVQTLNALSDSNRVLREERDRYAAELSDIKEKFEQVESQTLIPLRNENKQITMQLELLQTENIGLQKECNRWRTRVTEMTEKINKNNSEDLQKSLTLERDAHNKTLDDLRSVKQEKSKLEDQLKKLQSLHSRVAAIEKERADLIRERNDLQKELNEEKTKNAKVTQDFEELQKTLGTHETMINDMKQSISQIRSIAKRYKNQSQELLKQNEELKSKLAEQSAAAAAEPAPVVPAEIPPQEQDRLRQEGRQQLEAEMGNRIRELNEQITAKQEEIDRLLTENKALQDTVVEKEVRATDILKTARNRIQNLAKEAKKHQTDAESYKQQMQHIETATREEGIARQNVIKSTYENRISKLEKEKTEAQTERDRLAREVEILSQRIAALQRQLLTQQGVKSAVNSGQEKSNIEPPTANIKPMAGPSSSVAKSQQNQQSVAVTPWRSANETPFASIRPMSMQTRTAAVLPTSQTSCSSATQSTVLVPPQQQLVDTSSNAPSIAEAFSSSPSSSSHTDYNMPSTSSSVSHTSARQVVVTPTQQASHSAESTQDMEAECGNQELPSQAALSSQQQPSQMSQNQGAGISTLSIIATPSVSQSQAPTVALVLPRIDLQNLPTGGPSHLSNVPEQSMVASSQTTPASLVSASNQTDSSNTPKRTETYYQQDGEDSNPGQVSASNQLSQQQPVVASSIETAPEQSIVSASNQQSGEKTVSEPSVASSNANSSNTVTTTQAGLKRSRETEGESSRSSGSTEVNSVQPQAKRTRRMETVHEDIFRSDVDESSNADVLLRYGGIDVEYQVPTSSQRDQEFDNLVIDSEGEDELEEDEQVPDDGIIDENDDVPEDVEDEEEFESEEAYEMEGYDREEQDASVNRYPALGPDIDEVQVHDQDNEVEIIDEESNEVPNQSGRSDGIAIISARRGIEQQSSEATSSGNNMRAQSASITSNQSPIPLQFGRRSSTISPLNRQPNQQLLLSQGFEDNAGDDSIVPSTPTLCVPRRTDGFGEAVSSPHVPSSGRFTFSESQPPVGRAGVALMVSEGIDDTRMDLSQLEDNAGTGRSVPSTPLQSSPQEVDRIEVGQSVEDNQPLNEELSCNTNNQQQPPPEDILLDNVAYHGEPADNELEAANDSENLVDEPTDQGVTSDSGPPDQQVAGTSQNVPDDVEEGREAEAARSHDIQQIPQQILTTGGTARRGATRVGRSRARGAQSWENATISNTQEQSASRGTQARGRGGNNPRAYRRGNRRQRSWTPFGRY
ncbi:nucleoprotein TPR-like isoform X2 [Planococcus citri]|uniref:nucleoprotein TPR-like isoform X2 n=1 Tax=Planococcus citri TaxID=170843 RepID=UPI0031F88FA2